MVGDGSADDRVCNDLEEDPVEMLMTDDAAARANFVRVAVLDDHQAVRAGLEGAIKSQPGIVCVGTASDPEELAPLMYRARPNVVVVDFHLRRSNGLRLCRELKHD